MFAMNRRQFLQNSAALGLAMTLPACRELSHWGIPIQVYLPGMQEGHRLRDHTPLPKPSETRRVKVAILGSGVAGSFAGWRLQQAGLRDVVLVSGPEPAGNAAAGQFGASAESAYPRGAHYLPLPSLASRHVRELLAAMGVIEADPYSERPRYNETALIHAPQERLWVQVQWQEGLLPHQGIPAAEIAEQQRFMAAIQQLQHAVGADGRKVFAIPLALSSQDPLWRGLDQLSFAQWLAQQGYRAPSLLWYLDYACRDDYGIGLAQTSAWAGLHYFAARGGEAHNAEPGAVLTWPTGLNPILQFMQQPLRQAGGWLPGMAVALQPEDQHVAVDIWQQGKVIRLLAERVICAMPLHVAQRLLDLRTLGYEPAQALPHAAWQVSNFLLKRYPAEPAHTPLSWDNVVYGSPSLGFVNSTHQLIRAAKPAHTVFTAYHAYAGQDPRQVRAHLASANADALYQTAVQDLATVYGFDRPIIAQEHIAAVEITLRGHAMSSPIPGFLSHSGLAALRQHSGQILFAHSDLSGLSVFEEASWWGEQAAQRILG
ncbi:NAD(P)/FAD-dependent oxidoreductase [Chitinibacter tainanensis]|uniref:NAD(P)-binding protein n=1 Tax=Chitinibacter tainanensis TaxID=230667 RepID=UPI000416F46A|nr:NAD(P)/FAD-dependent oxidoreductase [Chitinibacter tainanensis]